MKLNKLLTFVQIALALCALATSQTMAFEQTTAAPFNGEQAFENYTVRYNVFNSTFVLPKVAQAYGIKRSAYESLINISVAPIGKEGAIPARISGTVTNLLQQQKPLDIIEIKEKTTTYYLSPLRISGEETVHIQLNVQPQGSDEVLNVKFSKKLYSDK